MSWRPATDYKARIGGILYVNVAHPIVCNNRSLIAIDRNMETGELAVSFELARQDGTPIALVTHNEVTLQNCEEYSVYRGPRRAAVIEKNGRIWCDIRSQIGGLEYEIELSCMLFSESGYPIVLHPDRSKFGKANDDERPNLAFFTMTTDPTNSNTAIEIKNNSIYLLGLVIENFSTGIRITHRDNHAT